MGLLAVLMLVTSVALFAQQIPPTSPDISKGQAEDSGPQGSFIPSYITHSPITITSNADFASQGFPGSGTPENPYLIEGYSITTGTCVSIQDTDAYFVIRDCLLTGGTTGKGVELDGVDHGEIQNNTISGNDFGVRFYESSGNTVVNNTFSGNRYGVYLLYSSDNIVVNNTISGNHYGVYLASSSNNTLVNNTISGNTSYGVSLSSSSNNTLVNNTISGNYYESVSLSFSSDNTLVNNTISGNYIGVRFYESSGNTVVNNTISGNDYDGMRLSSSSDNTLSSNIFVNNGIRFSSPGVESWRQNITPDNLVNGKSLGYFWNWISGTIDGTQYGQVILANCTGVTVEEGVFSNATVGIELGYSSYCSLMNNTISGNSNIFGVSLCYSSGNTVVNNTISGSDYNVHLHTSSDNTLVNNTISGNDYGVYLTSSSDNTIVNNTISGNRYGVYLFYSSDNTVVNNTISGNDYGVYLSYSSDNTVVNNTISGNDYEGVSFSSSSDNTLFSNIFVNNGIRISGNGVEYWRQNITTDNLVNGKPLGYFWNWTSGTIDGTQYGQVIFANCTGVTVKAGVFSNATVGIVLGYSSYCSLMNNIISGNDYGVYLTSSSDNTIVNNTISGNDYGVYLTSSSDNTIVNNTISGNDYGVYLYPSSNNTVVNNTISGNSNRGVYFYFSSNNIVMNNTISGNYYGVFFTSSSDNTVVNNTISGNSNRGVYISSSSDNLIYLNVIADNDNGNAYDSGTGNHWNTTGMGNYWSDYTGTGVYNVPGSAGSIDYYPFIYPPDTSLPSIDQPADMDYEEGTTGNTITWTPSDAHPSHHVVYRNGTEVASVSWDGSSITVEVDGLSVGIYNYTIVVYDISGNWVSDEVIVTVIDTTPPMIDHPDDVEYVVGTTGHSITWSPSDAHPSHHVVYRNGTEVASVSWDGSSILVNVDDLSVGVYNYTIVVYDTSGNWVSDIVIVTVLPETTTTTTDTTTTTSTTTTTTTDAGDMTSLGIVLISVSGIGVVVLIVMRYRRGSMTRS